MQPFADNLKRRREYLGISRLELSKITGLSTGAIGYYENDQREPTAGALIAIANALRVSVDELLGYTLPSIDKCNRFIEQCDLMAGTYDGEYFITDNFTYSLITFDSEDKFIEFVLSVSREFQNSNIAIEAARAYMLSEIANRQRRPIPENVEINDVAPMDKIKIKLIQYHPKAKK